MQQCLQCDHCKYFSFVLIFDEKKSLAPNQQANGEMVSLRHKVLINSQIQKLPLLRSTTAKGKVFFYCSIQKYFLRHTRLPFLNIGLLSNLLGLLLQHISFRHLSLHSTGSEGTSFQSPSSSLTSVTSPFSFQELRHS